MKNALLIGGIALVAYTVWKNKQGAAAALNSTGTVTPTPISVSPATLETASASCDTCDAVDKVTTAVKSKVSGLGAESPTMSIMPVRAGPGMLMESPSAVSATDVYKSFDRLDYSGYDIVVDTSDNTDPLRRRYGSQLNYAI